MENDSSNTEALKYVYTARQHSAFFQYVKAAEAIYMAIEVSAKPEYYLEYADYLMRAENYDAVTPVLDVGKAADSGELALHFAKAYSQYYFLTEQYAVCVGRAYEICGLYPTAQYVEDKEAFFIILYFAVLSLYELEKNGVNPPNVLNSFLKKVYAYRLRDISMLYTDEFVHMEYIRGVSLLKHKRFCRAFIIAEKIVRYYKCNEDLQRREVKAKNLMSKAKDALIKRGLIAAAVVTLMVNAIWLSSSKNRIAVAELFRNVGRKTVSENIDPNEPLDPETEPERYIVLNDETDGGNIRSGYGLNAPRVTVVYPGQKMLILGEYDDDGFIWYNIRMEDGVEGWISSRIVKPFEGA